MGEENKCYLFEVFNALGFIGGRGGIIERCISRLMGVNNMKSMKTSK